MNAIGVIETISIPLGVCAGDAMLKAAEVTLVSAQTACAGKYIVIVSGTVAAVKASVETGAMVAAHTLVDQLVIANIDSRVITAMSAATFIERVGALGLLETFSLAGAIQLADTAVKTSEVELVEVRLGRGMGGKSFVVFTGDVASVNAAITAAKVDEHTAGMLASHAVIPSPHPDLLPSLL